MCFNFLTRFFLQVRIENPNQPTSVFETVFKALAYIFLLFEILFLPLVKHHIDHPHCTRDKNAGSTIQRFRGGLGLCFGLALKQSWANNTAMYYNPYRWPYKWLIRVITPCISHLSTRWSPFNFQTIFCWFFSPKLGKKMLKTLFWLQKIDFSLPETTPASLLLKIGRAPQRKVHLPIIHFQVQAVSFSEGTDKKSPPPSQNIPNEIFHDLLVPFWERVHTPPYGRGKSSGPSYLKKGDMWSFRSTCNTGMFSHLLPETAATAASWRQNL